MTDIKITQLTEKTVLDDDNDVIEYVDVSLGASGSRKVKVGTWRTFIDGIISAAVTALKAATNTWSGSNTFGQQVISTVSTGTAPLSIASTTRVSNLNSATAGNADTVTTNANLTGPITSVGNATSVASQTGTGTTFVMNTSPILVTPSIGAATGASLDTTGATGVITRQAATQDAVRLLGRAGGSSSRSVTLTPAALGADRTQTLQDSDGTVALTPGVRSTNFTADLDQRYVITATAAVTDPTPAEGRGFEVLVRNGTATIGGTAYAAGQVVARFYHSGAWGTYTYGMLGATQTWTGANTFADTITVGTRAALAPSSFGYGAAWKCLLFGSTGTDYTSNAVTIAIGVDPSTNPGSSFIGNGSEILLRRNLILLQPNSGNTDWENASLTLGVTTFAGATPGTPAAGQVLIGGGDVKTAGAITASGNIITLGSLVASGQILIGTFTPSSASAAGAAGTICWDSSYIYVCVATNTWKRVAIATW
jgi:hypothetical protein